MLRRTFLKVATAAASIEFEPPDYAASDDSEPSNGPSWYRSFASALPTPAALGDPPQYAISLTQLDAETTVSDDVLAGASVCGTVFAGRTAVDVAFDATDTDRLRERLHAARSLDVRSLNGWTIAGRWQRNRYRLVAVDDSTAIVGLGPIPDHVRAVVHTTSESVDNRDDRAEPQSEHGTWQRLFDQLGTGRHVYVDTTPDHAPDSVVATGERYQHAGGRATIRHVTLFDTVRAARQHGPEDLAASRQLETTRKTVSSVTRNGHALVQKATIPTESPVDTS